MHLKYQLLLLGLLSLLLPITGWFALKSVDSEFRDGIEHAASNTLSSVQASVEHLIVNNNMQLDGLVLTEIDEISIDGYQNEWQDIPSYSYQSNNNELKVKLAKVKNSVALLIESNDGSVKSRQTPNIFSDYVLLGIINNTKKYQYKFLRQAEGKTKPNNSSKNRPEVKAYWHEKAQGFTLEILLHTPKISNLGFASINISHESNTAERIITGTLEQNNKQNLSLMPISSHNPAIQKILNAVTPDSNQLTIKDNDNRIIYQVSKLPNSKNASARQWLLTPIYQWLFSSSQQANDKWFYRENDGMAGVLSNMKVNGITYELKTMMPQGQQNMIQTLLKSAVVMIGIVLLIMFAYLLYALMLAWRVRNLNKALQSVLDDSGKVHIKMPSHSSKDEIGQLSRGIETMLIEVREYTQYLKELGSRLSHEMKTPLAIVQTSLDNIGGKQDSEFLQRAKDGTNRLKFILNQLSELSQLKYTLENTPKERFDLTKLCQQLGRSYQSYTPNLKLAITAESIFLDGSADLIAQMIDKLMENAKDFTPVDGLIELELCQSQKVIEIFVTNTGSQLPKNKQLKIFDSLVSKRVKNESSKTHLGMGLNIVQLIARYHKGKVTAKNLKNPDRVEFTVTIVDKAL